MTAVLVDAEGGVRDWLRAQAGVSALVGSRVYFGIPTSGATFPLVTVQTVGGGVDLYAPVDEPLLQLLCWGSGPNDKLGADAVARAAANAIWSFTPQLLAPGIYGLWAALEGRPIWSPDPISGRARYLVQASFGLRVD